MRPINRQVLSDRLFLWQMRTSRKPHFQGGLDTPPLTEHLRVLDLELPALSKPGRAEFRADTLAGEVHAAIHVHALGGGGAPVLIYHHGAGEIPATRTLEQMFPARKTRDLTILAVEAPFHTHPKEHKTASLSLLIYLAMLAVPIAATERLMQIKRVGEAPLRVVAGYDQGGYIANWHHLLYDSADLYIPFMAGTAQAELFLSSFKVAGQVRRRPERLRELLNMDRAWARRHHDNVFPVLGSADLVNRFDAQARSYGDTPIEVWPAGHIETAKNPARIREKILRHMHAMAEGPRAANVEAGLAEPGRLRA